MSIPNNILYPVDFSDRCIAFSPSVAGMSRGLRASITLLHALEIQHLVTSELSGELELIRKQIREKLRQFPISELDEGDLQRQLVEGPAADCIVKFVATMKDPIIMMPTRGHTRFRQLLLGSVTAAVLHDATCPVLTGTHSESEINSSGAFHSMVCAVDMGARTPDVLEAAIEFSGHFGASLHVVHSVPGIDPRFPSATADRAHAYLLDKAREEFGDYCRQVGREFPLEIAEDTELVDGILGVSARHSADILIIGRGVIQGALGRLRTNAHEIIRRSQSAVLSV